MTLLASFIHVLIANKFLALLLCVCIMRLVILRVCTPLRVIFVFSSWLSFQRVYREYGDHHS